jgi:hypothetical protein
MQTIFCWYIKFCIYSLFNHDMNNFLTDLLNSSLLPLQPRCNQPFADLLNSLYIRPLTSMSSTFWLISWIPLYYLFNHDANIILIDALNFIYIRSSITMQTTFCWYIEFIIYSLFNLDVNNISTDILNSRYICSLTSMQTIFRLMFWISCIFVLQPQYKQLFDWYIEFHAHSLFNHEINNILIDIFNFMHIRSSITMQTTFWLIYWIPYIFALQSRCK